MKKVFNIFRNIFAIIGLLVVLLFFCIKFSGGYLSYHEGDKVLYGARVDSLRTSGAYRADTSDFNIRIIQDTVRAKEIRDYFSLDTLFSPDADTWTKVLSIGKFVASNIPHDNQKEWPEHVNAIGLWEYTKTVAPAFNCRLHSILAFELFLAAGIDARYVTCFPQDSEDTDCHVVNEVWLPELDKWAMVDTDMGGHYATDLNGSPLSLKEIRDHYIAGEKIKYYPKFEKGSTKIDYYYAYMAKNTYWFSCWGELSYYQEDYDHEDVVRDNYINLVPSGFEPFRIGGGNTITTDAERFWTKPER